MTEEEWMGSKIADEMLRQLDANTNKRKMRLLACACCRRIYHLIRHEALRHAVEMAESVADRVGRKSTLLSLRQFRTTKGADRAALLVAAKHASIGTLILSIAEARWVVVHQINDATQFNVALSFESNIQASLIKEIFGNPFRPITINPNWLTPTVINLATIAYEERILPSGELDTTRLAILADALEEAGCDNQEMLGHLRSSGVHVRGCWALDLLLGME